ncbi:hypothetical protein C1H46_007761 [Malus baccata]|uniref:Uncharacterized protein n=1 Tax=Malus baccata TaxID=106549 RepID=A0A540N6L4_MALBA|nr:hypothetical protein C1H46_007761 [Malus baccata]
MEVEEETHYLTSLRQQEEEEERESFLALSCTCKVVEYLQPVMSNELLCKFPDNSAFDFDYSQSSIWSPLVPRAYAPMDLDLDLDLDFATPRKLNFEMGLEVKNQNSLVEAGSGIKKKKKIPTATTCFNLNRSALKNKLMKRKKSKMVLASDFSPTPVNVNCNPIASKVWNKVLKAASKHFKKKKRDPMDHVRFSNYLRPDGNV